MLVGGVLDAAVVQVTVETCLVDRVHRAQSHGDGRELPEIRHAVRVRVGRDAVALTAGDLLAEAVEVVLAQAPLEEGAGVDAGGGVALEEDLVAAARVVLAAPEVVEADLVERGGGGVGGDVAAHADARTLRAVHHDGGVPAHPAAVALLHLLVARKLRLHGGGDGVHEVRGGEVRQRNALEGGTLQHAEHEVAGAGRVLLREETVEGVHPLLGLLGVGVFEVGRDAVADRRVVGVALAAVRVQVICHDVPPGFWVSWWSNGPAGKVVRTGPSVQSRIRVFIGQRSSAFL